MAYYQQYTYSTKEQFIIDFAAFIAANGWTIDANGTYSGSYRRVHFHQGEAHFELYNDASYIQMLGCTAYDGGQTPANQPGKSTGRTFNVPASCKYWFFSTVGAIYIGVEQSVGGNIGWGAIFRVQEKIGSWDNGFGLIAPVNGTMFHQSSYNTSVGILQLYYAGAWTPTTAAGAIGGSVNIDITLVNKQPFKFNAGILPIPVLLYRYNTSDTSKKHPLGFVPGLYRTNGGNIYVMMQEIVIGGATYLIMPSNGSVVGGTNNDFLFKLGA